MAIVKDLRDTYWCKTDGDRNRITPYVGQKCLMTNGDLYVCLHYGEWSKIGDAPTPPTPPTPSLETWADLSQLTWAQLSNYTWGQLGQL